MTAAHGPRPARRDRPSGLYEPLGWAVLRAPLLPAGTRDAAPGSASDSSLMPADPLLGLAIRLASPDLAAALERTGPHDRQAPRLERKLRRYLIRMTTRPTPFGLFAGVGLVRWAPATDLGIDPAASRTATRADMGWLNELTESLREDPDIGPHLRLMTSPAVSLHRGRAVLTQGPAAGTSVRATAGVRLVLGAARLAASREELEQAVRAIPGATPEKTGRLVEELRSQGFLISELSPAPTRGDPVTWVRRCLGAIPSGRARAAERQLGVLAAELADWDELPLDRKAEHLPALRDLLADVHRAVTRAGSDTARAGAGGVGIRNGTLQTDTALAFRSTALHAAVAAEAAEAAELLLRLSRLPRAMPHLDDYRRAFEGRYGAYRQVPLLELLDPATGLGPPSAPRAGGPGSGPRDRLLLDLAVEAVRERRRVVELDDELLSRLATPAPAPEDVPPSLELSFFVAATSPDAVDRGDFRIVVGPNAGVCAAGRSLGRFAALLGPPAAEALEELARTEQVHEPDTLIAEVVHAPDPPRSANVALRPAVRRHEILVDAWPGVPPEGVIPVRELVVGIRNGRFVIGWPAGGAEVIGVQGHMLNTRRASAAVRFLVDVTHDRWCRLSGFSWGPAAGLGRLPRVQRHRTVLAPAQWRPDPAMVDSSGSEGGFGPALATWRSTWDVPSRVYLTVADHRLLLDLDDPRDVELLRDELRTGARDGYAVLQEALPGPEHAWLPGPDGGHMCEVVAPLVRRGGARRGGVSPDFARVVDPVTRLRPPGSDWLYLKLYCEPRREEELIGGPVRAFAEQAASSGLADGWFFVRYADPEPHVRLRLHRDPAAPVGPLMEQACAWAGGLTAEGLCGRFSFETYEREVERYGGEAGTAAAEALFTADSPGVAEMLRARTEGRLDTDLPELAVATIDDLLACLGLSPEERAAFSYGGPSSSRQGGTEYRRRQQALRRALGGAAPAGGELSRLLTARRSVLGPAVARIEALHQRGGLWQTREALCHSLVHMHANRLLGIDPSGEALALELLRRTRAGLVKAPLAPLSREWRDSADPRAADQGRRTAGGGG
ncbi:lantibiotic dehydratase [Streptomyces flavotricini]|uniref:Lantibiotic dehydratase n=1 Tax=Streptomyces flavotricini TaxID=66888 RepID=A0ABS8E143_9ACTN|nr:lantibiotic dehydratase [Streptomyces flavotricini]MCC0094872.1 lantibiotic dehydratase [Streptomyces flavotricini]